MEKIVPIFRRACTMPKPYQAQIPFPIKTSIISPSSSPPKRQDSNQDYQKVDSAYQNAFSRHPQKAWKYTLISVCLPEALSRFRMKHQSATPIKVLCNTSGFCFWAYPVWSSPAYWRQLVAVHNAQRHRIQSSFPRMLQSPAVF